MSTSKTRQRTLKNVVIAVEPVTGRTRSFGEFSAILRRFQSNQLLVRPMVASMIHSSLYLVPLSWYRENEDRYAEEAKASVERACRGLFDYRHVKVLKGTSSANRLLIEQLSEFLKSIRSDLLVVLSSNRKGLPHWLLGSFAETAALTAATPVLVVKPQVKPLELSRKPRLCVALDASAQYSTKQMKWLADLALPARAHIDIISVRPNSRKAFSALRKPSHPRLANSRLKELEKYLNSEGLSTTLSLVNEKESVAATIVDFADKKRAWAVVSVSTERRLMRKLLLGSTARKILSLTRRPFISLRFG